MKVEAKQVVAALDAAIEDQRRHVVDFEEDYEAGYLDGLVRALDIVQAKARPDDRRREPLKRRRPTVGVILKLI